MISIAQNNQLFYRTKLMRDLSKAERFASCLKANRLFTSAEVVRSTQCKGDGYFVEFLPSGDNTTSNLFQSLVQSRQEKANSEGSYYHFELDESGRFAYCLSTSGEVYECTTTTCECPDFEFRGRKLGIQCKHQLALRMRLKAQQEGRIV